MLQAGQVPHAVIAEWRVGYGQELKFLKSCEGRPQPGINLAVAQVEPRQPLHASQGAGLSREVAVVHCECGEFRKPQRGRSQSPFKPVASRIRQSSCPSRDML